MSRITKEFMEKMNKVKFKACGELERDKDQQLYKCGESEIGYESTGKYHLFYCIKCIRKFVNDALDETEKKDE